MKDYQKTMRGMKLLPLIRLLLNELEDGLDESDEKIKEKERIIKINKIKERGN